MIKLGTTMCNGSQTYFFYCRLYFRIKIYKKLLILNTFRIGKIHDCLDFYGQYKISKFHSLNLHFQYSFHFLEENQNIFILHEHATVPDGLHNYMFIGNRKYPE